MRDIKYNKIFGIYSLILPLIVVGLFFFAVYFGTMDADTVSRPYGKVSDFISMFIQIIICPALFIVNILLFCLTVRKTIFYTISGVLIILANTILCLQLMLTIINIWALIFTFFIVQPLHLIIWITFLIGFIIDYKKIQNKDDIEEGQVLPDK